MRCSLGLAAVKGLMVEEWLGAAMAGYNSESLERRDEYAALLCLPGEVLEQVLLWGLQSLPDEILVGFDVDPEQLEHPELLELFRGVDHRDELFSGQGFVLGEATLVNRGDSFSVHHVPEEWVDDFMQKDRGPRGGRFQHWLHTHPNAVAIPSAADANASQHTEGVDMILGVEFSPAGPLPWFEAVDGVRRKLSAADRDDRPSIPEQGWGAGSGRSSGWGRGRFRGRRDERVVLGRAPTGHLIHGLELISFHHSGLAINVIFVDAQGWPYGWEELLKSDPS